MDNCVYATKQILKILKIPHTDQHLEDNLISHPAYPSLLAISDTLSSYKIENLALEINFQKLKGLPLPCIVQVEVEGNFFFYILNAISDQEISYYTKKGNLVIDSIDNFTKIWTGISLVVEKSSDSKEAGIEKKLARQRMMNYLQVAIVIFLTIWIFLTFFNLRIVLDSSSFFFSVIFTFLKMIGLTATVFLLWWEVDEFNPTLQNLCSGGGRTSCSSVLNSKYANIFNGSLSLSSLGFSYFFGTLCYLLISDISISALSNLSYFSFTGIPIIILSTYYQAVVLKQWCKFCLVVQAVLVLEITIALLSGFYKLGITAETIPLLFLLLLIPVVGWRLLKPLLEKEKEMIFLKRSLKKIKNNPEVLKGLLLNSRKITKSTEGIGISINRETAKYSVIKVCNPYCGPCAKAHPVLENLVTEGKINLQIIFTPKDNGNEYLVKPVKHLMAIDAQGDKSRTQAALDKWYYSEQKDYSHFANIFPLNGELEQQTNKIKAMNAWCEAERITHTPTIFINGHELPKEYSVEDLTEVLK